MTRRACEEDNRKDLAQKLFCVSLFSIIGQIKCTELPQISVLGGKTACLTDSIRKTGYTVRIFSLNLYFSSYSKI